MPENQSWLIWNFERGMWWKPHQLGYTDNILEAGRYSYDVAVAIVREANAPLLQLHALTGKFVKRRGDTKPKEAMVPSC